MASAAYSAYTPGPDFDVEKGSALNDFSERIVRQGFVKKVFGLLAVQLLLTTAIAGTMVFSAPVKAFVATNPWLLLVSLVVSLGIILTFSFSEKARQSHPTNLVLLFAFTAAEGVLVGAASGHSSTDAVVLAFGITAIITTGLALYALTTKSDFTASGTLLFCCLLGLISASFVGWFIRPPGFQLVLSGFGAVLFSAYIVWDVQMLLGGKHKFAISPDEYVFGAIAIYLDIINLFLHILRMLNSRD